MPCSPPILSAESISLAIASIPSTVPQSPRVVACQSERSDAIDQLAFPNHLVANAK